MDHLGAANRRLAGSLRHIPFTPRWCAPMDKRGKVDSSSSLIILIIIIIIISEPILSIRLTSVPHPRFKKAQAVVCLTVQVIKWSSEQILPQQGPFSYGATTLTKCPQNPFFSNLISYLVHRYIKGPDLRLSHGTPQLSGQKLWCSQWTENRLFFGLFEARANI